MFPVETDEVLAEQLADIGGAPQCAVVFECALPHERDAIDRYAEGSLWGSLRNGVLRRFFLGKQPELFLH